MSQIYPQFTLANVNRLERLFCSEIKWDLYISSSLYAKYYFALRALTEKNDFRRCVVPVSLRAYCSDAVQELQHHDDRGPGRQARRREDRQHEGRVPRHHAVQVSLRSRRSRSSELLEQCDIIHLSSAASTMTQVASSAHRIQCNRCEYISSDASCVVR